MCFRDMTFCSAVCLNTECKRNFTPDDAEAADKWWGDSEGEPPIAWSDFSKGCTERKLPEPVQMELNYGRQT